MSTPSTPSIGVVALLPSPETEWQTILHASNQVVLYNPTSHALSIRHSSKFPERLCPYCKQKVPPGFRPSHMRGVDLESMAVDDGEASGSVIEDHDDFYTGEEPVSRASDYFQLLAIANETSSRPSSPPPIERDEEGAAGPESTPRTTQAFPAEAMAEGYFKAFFQEEFKLGMGANGSVFLCQHLLDGNPLGHFAVKKIAVGESHSYLLSILREVRLLERLHHPNIITYHHAWLETCQFSSFGPKVPTLHVLMQWAEGGSLDDLIDARLGRGKPHVQLDPLAPFAANGIDEAGPFAPHPAGPDSRPPSGGNDVQHPTSDLHSRTARIRAFRALQRASPEEKMKMRREKEEVKGTKARPSWKAVHLLSAEEVKSLFTDVTEGLGFLHNKSILHLDLKPGNVLLTWDDGKLIPRAMLSDFGTSRDRISTGRIRSGNTGTLEYASPESLPSPHTGLLQQVDSKADMWSLGMILHRLLFFRLPYRNTSDAEPDGEHVSGEAAKLDRLEREVLGYPGFKSNSTFVTAFEARRLPRSFLILLEGLLNVTTITRPSCERVLSAIRDGKLDPLRPRPSGSRSGPTSLIPMTRLRSDAPGSTLAPFVPVPQVTRQPSNGGLHSPSPAASFVPTLPEPQGSVEPQGDEVEGEAETPTQEVSIREGKRNERTPPLLALPSPPLSESESIRDARRGWTGWLTGSRKGSDQDILKHPLQLQDNTRTLIRVLKSCILSAKIMSIASICSSTDEGGPRPLITSFLVAIAIADSWFEEIWVSILLVVIHVGLVLVLRQWCRSESGGCSWCI
ncbi:kinase-like protein [Pluteus cervinus]|uniref:Kinase-like protein n=1 Tax=Pluteus cervinus TaxID=181527 RepID=A0ACD3B059_9AGAR|nr:kinase-like protein [Pluteus cervinus]